jgi:signal transduction histidine kinase/ligand-binding sensor domain-containing protein
MFKHPLFGVDHKPVTGMRPRPEFRYVIHQDLDNQNACHQRNAMPRSWSFRDKVGQPGRTWLSGIQSFICSIILGVAPASLPSFASAQNGFLIRTWQSEDGLPGNVVRSISQGSNGFLWVATAEGIARFDGTTFHPIPHPAGDTGRRNGFFRTFATPDGSIWVSTFRGGLLKVEGESLQRVIADPPDDQMGAITHVHLAQGRLWIRRDQRWHFINPSGEVIASEPYERIRRSCSAHLKMEALRGRRDDLDRPTSLTEKDGGVWRITNGTLSYLGPGSQEKDRRTVSQLGARMIANDLLEDREGNLWIANPVAGLVRVRRSRVVGLHTATGIYDQPVHTAITTRDGSWWIANRNGGIDRISEGRIERLDLVEGGYFRPVICLFEDSQGRLWLASRDGSVFRWNGEAFDIPFEKTHLISKVNAITETPDGTLWFAGSQGLSAWDGRIIKNLVSTDDYPAIEFTTMAAVPGQGILAGTSDGRLLHVTLEKARALETPPALKGKWISSVLHIQAGEIWITTIGAGLFLRTSEEWHHFDSNDGLPDERLTAVIREDEDGLWLGSLGGIIRTSRSSLLQRITNRELVPRWLRLDRSDGLLTRECIGGSQPAAWQSVDGTLWFPTSSGLAGVNPARIRYQTIPPLVYLQSVQINGLSHPLEQDKLVVGPGSVRAAFSFNGLSLSAPEDVTYKTRLVGIDEDFRFVGGSNEARYEALPPGRYRFEVHAINGDGIATIRPAGISIHVQPHLWQTPWFIALCTVSGTAASVIIGGWIVRQRLKQRLETLRLKGALENERSRISRDLHDDLGASLTELSILSSLTAESTADPAARNSIQQISGKARHVVAALDEIVWATNPTEDSLRSLVDYLAAFAREFLESAQIPLRTQIERQIPDVAIGPRRRHNVFLATREAINNAVKHGQPTAIDLHISIEAQQLVIRIRDNGRGFHVDYAASGNGLTNLRTRMRECGGDCSLESAPRRGTTVTLTLPIPPH